MLNHPQEFSLRLERQMGNLIKHQGAAMRGL